MTSSYMYPPQWNTAHIETHTHMYGHMHTYTHIHNMTACIYACMFIAWKENNKMFKNTAHKFQRKIFLSRADIQRKLSEPSVHVVI